MPAETIRFTLDGREVAVTAEPAEPLANLLREACGIQGVRVACSRAVCGACTILVDGEPAASCAMFAYQAEGRAVETVAGLSQPGQALHPLQEAFARHAAFQCGTCTAGFLMLAKALLARHPEPDRATIAEWLSSNICRCTGYGAIIAAVEEAAAMMRAEKMA
ncbi:MAG: (2Fe-2S)-binding protein [Acetobacteraceae bacterium]|nr:(2Fe-2S)-binding protein [Acetobacteraceae bacterium]